MEKRGRGAWSSRWAHNPEFVGSNPTLAIKNFPNLFLKFVFLNFSI